MAKVQTTIGSEVKSCLKLCHKKSALLFARITASDRQIRKLFIHHLSALQSVMIAIYHMPASQLVMIVIYLLPALLSIMIAMYLLPALQ